MFGLDFIRLKAPPSPPIVKRHFLKRKETMDIVDYLDKRLISFLEVETRDEAIDALIDLIYTVENLPSKSKFRSAVMHREGLVSTGIGLGIAIPHAKLSDLDHFFIAIGIQRKKGVDWNALDKAPVRLIFLIGGPDHRQSEYLQILSRLTAAIKDVDRRKEILKAETAQDVMSLFGIKLPE